MGLACKIAAVFEPHIRNSTIHRWQEKQQILATTATDREFARYLQLQQPSQLSKLPVDSRRCSRTLDQHVLTEERDWKLNYQVSQYKIVPCSIHSIFVRQWRKVDDRTRTIFGSLGMNCRVNISTWLLSINSSTARILNINSKSCDPVSVLKNLRAVRSSKWLSYLVIMSNNLVV